jgi:hypothetical protein
MRETPRDPLQIGEDAVTALGVKRGDRFTKDRLLVNRNRVHWHFAAPPAFRPVTRPK